MAAPRAGDLSGSVGVGRSAAAGERDASFTPAYRAYALSLLVVVYVLNFVDRQILSILGKPIADEFGLSDTQLGLLGGPAFAVFYTFVGIPIARWADVGVRRSIIALAMCVWSGMTAVTYLATGFLTLALARIGVGVGEAGCSPPAHSLISDLFPAERRATALSIYSLGIPIGGALGSLLGGWLGQAYGWRIAFLAVGLPGVLMSLLVRFTLREPPRTEAPARKSALEVLQFMLRRRSFVHISAGAALHAFSGYGAAYFIPVFLIRVHGFQLGEVGTWLFGIGLTTGVAGTFLGGAISDRLAAAEVRWYMRVPAIASLIGIPFALLFYLWPSGQTALLLSIPGSLVAGIYLGPTFAMTQSLARSDMRALAAAILLFIINLIGFGLGPAFVGWLSEALKPTYGVDSIRYALLGTVVVCGSWAALHYTLAARTLREDLRAKDA